jgi:hypothetical protein
VLSAYVPFGHEMTQVLLELSANNPPVQFMEQIPFIPNNTGAAGQVPTQFLVEGSAKVPSRQPVKHTLLTKSAN